MKEAENPQPPVKPKIKFFVGGFGTMFFAFGIMNFLNGQEVPWGYQQTAGFIMAIIGIVLFGIAKFVLK